MTILVLPRVAHANTTVVTFTLQATQRALISIERALIADVCEQIGGLVESPLPTDTDLTPGLTVGLGVIGPRVVGASAVGCDIDG